MKCFDIIFAMSLFPKNDVGESLSLSNDSLVCKEEANSHLCV